MQHVLAFKDELVYDLIGLVRAPENQEDANEKSRRSRQTSLIQTVF